MVSHSFCLGPIRIVIDDINWSLLTGASSNLDQKMQLQEIAKANGLFVAVFLIVESPSKAPSPTGEEHSASNLWKGE